MSPNQPDFKMGQAEFVALIAMMFATIAFSIDAMLPALPEMAAELSPNNSHRAPLILTAFVLGMGIGTFVAGPLSDTFGRRRVIFGGALLYIVSSAVAWMSSSLEVMLIARLVQGLGASAPRIVSVAVVRDLFAGRDMARITSIVMMIFTLVPAIAPLLGAWVTAGFGWRAIFLAFILFISIAMLWMGLRLSETLPMEKRRSLRLNLLASALIETISHPSVRIAILVQSLAMAMLFCMLMQVQPIYFEVYDRAESFPYWFGLVSILAGSASLVNAALVGRFGMRFLVTVTLLVQILLSFTMFILDLGAAMEPYGFLAFVVFQTCLFAQAGLTLGNLNAIAMEPMGHIAGMAASVVSGVSTVLAAAIASPLGLLFDGSIQPLVGAILAMAVIALVLMRYLVYVERQMVVAEGVVSKD